MTSTSVASKTTLDISASSTFATGTLTTIGLGPVTFDLLITPTIRNLIAQNLGYGVTGGTAVSGIDNNNASGPQEALTFAISDFTGLGAGESLVVTQISVLFGNTNESYTINGGASTLFATDSTSVPEVIGVNGTTVTIGAGTSGDTRFAVDSFTVAVIPEPTSLALLCLGGLTLATRRRRA